MNMLDLNKIILDDKEYLESINRECVYLYIKTMSVDTAKNGSTYLKGTLSDYEVDIDFKIWNIGDYNPVGQGFNQIKIDSFSVNEFNGKKQLIIRGYEFMVVPIEEIPKNFDEKVIRKGIDYLYNSISSELYRRIIKGLVIDNEEFWIKPAAVAHHHNYIGGLAQHSCEVALIALNNCKSLLNIYKAEINKDVIITGALLHDIGKTKLYDLDGITPVYNEFYGLYEHLVYGVILLREYLKDNGLYNGNEKKVALIEHIILSHHGKKEYGSPVNPQFKEAYIVSEADMLSSQYNKLEKLSKYPDDKNPERVGALEYACMFTNKYIMESVEEKINIMEEN